MAPKFRAAVPRPLLVEGVGIQRPGTAFGYAVAVKGNIYTTCGGSVVFRKFLY